MKTTNYLLIFSLFLVLTSCTFDSGYAPTEFSSKIDAQLGHTLELAGGAESFMLPDPTDLNRIPQDPQNLLTPEKVRLGKQLYHETGLARNPKIAEGLMTYSCASCHHADAGFQAGIPQGIGEGGWGFGLAGEGRRANPAYPLDSLDVQPIRSPSALNIAFQQAVLWNGQFGATGPNTGTEAQWLDGTPLVTNELGYEGTETQAIAGLKVHRMKITPEIIEAMNYREQFDAAFPFDAPEGRYSRENAGLAIAAYERTLMATEAPFQRWLQGDNEAMDEVSKRGAILFFGKAGCVSCHKGPALNDMAFYALGMKDLGGNDVELEAVPEATRLGRGGFTQNPEDNYKFKVPQLYNLKDSPFLGHGASFRSVKEVLAYKNEGTPENDLVPEEQLAQAFRPLNLTQQEVLAITAFIEDGLYDPDLNRYVPKELPSGLCFPNADARSSRDLGCR